MSCLNYSKWDHIEVSDDEDDTHPNIDTPSLFRWRHQARVDRMEQAEKEKTDFKKEYQTHQSRVIEIKQKLREAETKAATEELGKLKLELSEIEKQEEDFRKKEAELQKKEKLTPWNIDTLCKEGKSKTIINKVTSAKKEDLTDEEKAIKQQEFTKAHESEVKKFGLLKRYEDSQAYLTEHPALTCEETANYLVLWCVNLQVEEKHDLMSHVAHQTIVMQFILELAKSLDMDPRNCVRGFFSRIQMAEQQYKDAFNDELRSFKDRVKARAAARIEEAIKQAEEEEREKRLGPGGLDPVDVYETLPQELRDCFDSKDVSLLQKVLLEMKREDAEYHMKRCVDSGLWVANANEGPGAATDKAGDEEEEEEHVYEDVNDLD